MPTVVLISRVMVRLLFAYTIVVRMRVSIDCIEKRFAVRRQIHPICPSTVCLTVNINSNGLDWRIITLRHALVLRFLRLPLSAHSAAFRVITAPVGSAGNRPSWTMVCTVARLRPSIFAACV